MNNTQISSKSTFFIGRMRGLRKAYVENKEEILLIGNWELVPNAGRQFLLQFI